MLLALALPLVLYFSELASGTLSIDEEVQMFQSDIPRQWLSQGRWGMAMLSILLPQLHAAPMIPLLLFCAGLSLSSLIVSENVTKTRTSRTIFLVTYICSPIWPHIAQFNTLNWGIGLGLFLSAWATGAVEKDRRYWGASVAALTISVSIYQSLIFVFIAGVLLRLVKTTQSAGSLLKTGARLALTITASATAYLLLTRLALAATGEHLTYVQRYNHAGQYLDGGLALSSARAVLRDVASLLMGLSPIYLSLGLLVMLPIWLGAIAITLGHRKRNEPSQQTTRAVELAAVGVTVLVALTPIVLSAGVVETRARTLLGLPVAMAGVASFADRFRNAAAGRAAAVATAGAAAAAMLIVSTLFSFDRWARYADAITTAHLTQRIAEVDQATGPMAVAVVGHFSLEPSFATRRVDEFGVSMFEADAWFPDAPPQRTAAMLRLGGLPHVRPVSISALADHRAEYMAMPSWPQQGSVRLIAGVVVIKFSQAGP